MLGANAGRALSFEQARKRVHELLQSPEWSGKWLAVLDDLQAPSPAEMEGAGLAWLLGPCPRLARLCDESRSVKTDGA